MAPSIEAVDSRLRANQPNRASRRIGADLLDLDAIRTLKAERHLRHFVRQAWHIVEPGTPYKHNWHIDVLCDHLEATLPTVDRSDPDQPQLQPGKIRNFLVTMPPRAMKSLIVSVFFPAWVWISRPELRFLYASYAQSLATEHSMLTRMVIESDWYQERWGDRFQLADDDNLKTRFSNTSRGQRIATSVGSSVTGFGGDYVICDDPHNVQQVESDSIREAAVRWWNKSMSTRRNDPATGVRIVVMQRVHESDVAGSCIDHGEYEHLNLPQEFEGDSPPSLIGWTDPRTEHGELLWPDRMTPEFVEGQKRDLGSYEYAAQHQQRPSPAEGGEFKRYWWKYWQPTGANLPPVDVKMPDGTTHHVYAENQPPWWDTSAQSWDMNFKKTESGSYVVGLVAATFAAKAFLLDCYRDRVDFTEAVRAVRSMTNQYPWVSAKLIENKANGPAVISTLNESINGIIPVEVEGSKEARARSATPHVEAGNWYLPHPEIAPWVHDFIDELSKFPTGKNDDQVDAFSQADRYLMSNAGDLSELEEFYSRQGM